MILCRITIINLLLNNHNSIKNNNKKKNIIITFKIVKIIKIAITKINSWSVR